MGRRRQVWIAATATVDLNHQLAEEAERQRLAKIAEHKRKHEEWRQQQIAEAQHRQEKFVELAGGFNAALFRAVVVEDIDMLQLLVDNGLSPTFCPRHFPIIPLSYLRRPLLRSGRCQGVT